MKRNIFVLGSVGAALLFAGGVVAAYTVTDNAEKTGIKITPGTITDDKVGSVTLEWGDMKSFTNIEGLSSNADVTKTVNVVATVKDEEGTTTSDAYAGKLDVELRDLSGKKSTDVRLIDYLHVTINGYAYNVGEKTFADTKTKLGEIPTEGEGAFSTSFVLYSNKDGKSVDFVISLDASATPVMAQIMSDQVYLTVDWNRGSDSEGMKHVYIPANGWSAMNVYAYSEGGKQNADWPGVAFTLDPSTGMFEGDLPEHDYYIFSDGGTNQYPASGEAGMKKADIGYATAGAIYFDWTTHKFTNVEPVVAAPFYLVGETTMWDSLAEYGFEAADTDLGEGVSHQWKLVKEVETGKGYKICSGDRNTWVGYNEIETDAKALVTDDSGNFKFKTAGTYTFYLKVYTGGNYSLWIAGE